MASLFLKQTHGNLNSRSDRFWMMLLVCSCQPLKIGNANLRLSSVVKSKGSKLSRSLDVLNHSFLQSIPSFAVFQRSLADFWASAYVHNRSLATNPGDQFELSSTKCLSGKKLHTDSLRLEDFIYQIENKNTKKGNAMYYPRFTKLVVNFVMDKDHSIPQRNKEVSNNTQRNEKKRSLEKEAELLRVQRHISEANLTEAEQLKDTHKVEPEKSRMKYAKKKWAKEMKRRHRSNANHEGRDDVMIRYTGVDVIFGQHAEATSQIDIHVIAIAEPSFFAPSNRPPTSNPLFIQLQQPPILTPATTPSSPPQNLPDFASLFRMKKVIKELVKKEVSKITPKIKKLVNEQLKSEVLVRSSKEAKTSHAVAANLSELELKKILIDKMEANNSINRSAIQMQLYKALVDAYKANKILLDTYGNTVTIKRPWDGVDDDQEPSAGTDRGSKRRRRGKEPESTSAPRETTTTTAGKTTTVFENRCHVEQAEEESVPAVHESVQPWLSNLARRQDPRESFDELTDTTFDFSAFVMNRLNVKTLTPELLAGPTFELMKGTCKSLTELEYFCEEVYKATTEKLDWINPEGRQYPHDLRQPLPLVPNSQVMNTKAADYGHIKWIEDCVPNSMWSQMIVKYDKFALWGISHWGKKRRQFYAFATTRESARDVYSKRRIIAVTKVEIVKWQNYKHLDWITVRRDDDILYKFKEGDFHRLRIQDIEDMLLLLVQGKVTNLNVEECIAFNVSLTEPKQY
ncbi:hypothetical protein Tco_0257014 [Tanacetum coccineum]